VPDGLRHQFLSRAGRSSHQRREIGHSPVQELAITAHVVREDRFPHRRAQPHGRSRDAQNEPKDIGKGASNLKHPGKRVRQLIGQRQVQPVAVASETGGLATFISSGDDFQQHAQAFRRKLVRPSATNVKIGFDGAAVYDLEPPTLPNLYHGQPVRLYGRYKTSGTANVNVSAEILGSPLEQTVEVTLPAADDKNPEIERMWAWHRAERLMGEERKQGTTSHRDEIVRLCEGYSIASEYASFIVLENDAEYQRWRIDRRNATRVARDRQAQTAVREQLQALRRQTAQRVGPQNTEGAAVREPPDISLAGNSVGPAKPTITGPRVDAVEPQTVSAPSGGQSGGGAGGAIDPLTAAVAAGLAGLGYACRRRRSPDERGA
jgi:Ca-activated chloride channel homolog